MIFNRCVKVPEGTCSDLKRTCRSPMWWFQTCLVYWDCHFLTLHCVKIISKADRFTFFRYWCEGSIGSWKKHAVNEFSMFINGLSKNLRYLWYLCIDSPTETSNIFCAFQHHPWHPQNKVAVPVPFSSPSFLAGLNHHIQWSKLLISWWFQQGSQAMVVCKTS